MKKASLILVHFFAIFLLFLTTIHASSVASVTEIDSTSSKFQVEHLAHTVKIQDYGVVIMNDTFELSSENGVLQDFSLGFPSEFGSNLDYAIAYDNLNPNELLKVELDVGLGRIGFYGLRIVYPEPGLNIGSEADYVLTIIFVFSDLLTSDPPFSFVLDYPIYPSLAQNVSVCDVKVILPANANYSGSSHIFNISSLDSNQILEHTISPLDSFQYAPASLTFDTFESFPLIAVNSLERKINLNHGGDLHVSDSYRLVNQGFSITTIEVGLPEGAHDISARDELGDLVLVDEVGTRAIIAFRDTLELDSIGEVTLTYSLPWRNYVDQVNWQDYNLTLTFNDQIHWTISRLSIMISLNEGAEFKDLKPENLETFEKSNFQEKATFVFLDVTPLHDPTLAFSYSYTIFWQSFRPTLWMGVLIIIVCAIALLRGVPTAPAIPIVPVPPKDLESFVQTYERKTSILMDIGSIEQKLRKGSISRRRYKVQRKMLEGRLSSLSRDLGGLQEKIRASGSKYASVMRQIEVAETMLEGVDKNIRRVEARYRRGELSKGAYLRLIDEYRSRNEKAKTTIEGALLRLREEIP